MAAKHGRHIKVGSITMASLGVTVPRGAARTEWEQAMTFACWARAHGAWWIGDMIRLGLQRYGDGFWQAVEIEGVSLEMLHRYRAVAEKVPPENRRETLSWNHHAIVANWPQSRQVELLDHAEQEGLTSHEFQRYVRWLRGRDGE